jgi:hypothetical protein
MSILKAGSGKLREINIGLDWTGLFSISNYPYHQTRKSSKYLNSLSCFCSIRNRKLVPKSHA